MIDFSPTEEQALVIETVHQFAENEIRSLARDADEKREIPAGVLEAVHELGLVANAIPAEFGGAGEPSAVLSCMVAEELAWGDLSIALVALSPSLLALPVTRFGTTEQRQRILPTLVDRRFVPGAIAAVEPSFDSDVYRPTTVASRDGEQYRLEGRKCQVPWTDGLREVLVFASLENQLQGFLVPTDAAGVSIERESNLGTQAAPLVEMTLSGVRIPTEARLGGEDGANLAELIDRGRVGLAACAVGMSRAAFEIARDYAKERETFGAPIATRQSIAFKLADLAIEIDGTRLLIWEAACALDAGEPSQRLAALAYQQAKRTVLNAADDAVQILGGYGFIRDYLPEMYLRNAGGFISSFELLTLV